MEKSNLILFLLLLLLWNNIYAQRTIDEVEFYTDHEVTLPVIKINNELFLKDLDSLVLSYKLHTQDEFKYYAYDINVHIDTSALFSTIYLGLIPEAAGLANGYVKGIFKRDGVLFLYFIDNPDSLYSYTGEYEHIHYKRLDIKREDQTIEEDVNSLYDFPSWIFLYKDHRLRLYSTQFVPRKEEDDKK